MGERRPLAHFLTVIPANAETRLPQYAMNVRALDRRWQEMGPRLRGDDGEIEERNFATAPSERKKRRPG